MTSIRRSVLIVSSERYAVFILLFITAAVMARLLTPHEIGLSVIGTSAIMMAEALRDFGTGAYLVQEKEITREDTRTVFLVVFLIAASFSSLLAIFANPIAGFYGHVELAPYLHLIAVGVMIGPFFSPVMALLRRDLAFVQIAWINIVWTLVGSTCTIVLALLGFSYMSFAWAYIIGSCAAAALTLFLRPSFWMYAPSIKRWKTIFRFGRYSSVVAVADRSVEVGQYWLLGRALDLEAVGLYSRALMVAGLPDKVLFSGIWPVALPAFAAQAREGINLKRAYMSAIGYMTVVHWPALLLVTFLAHPFVRLFLGEQWTSIAPLVQIIALGRILSFPVSLSSPLLVALGQIRRVALISSIIVPVNLAVFLAAAWFGLHAVAWSTILTTAFHTYVALRILRLSVPFALSELAEAVRKSFLVSLMTAAGPATVVTLANFDFDLSLLGALCAILLAALGWVGGLWITGHPMLSEITGIAREARRTGLRRA